jgi:pilus assembly protein Flp/PilA
MGHFISRLWALLQRDRRGQDLIEYALLAGFVAVAVGAIFPTTVQSFSTLFSHVTSTVSLALSEADR